MVAIISLIGASDTYTYFTNFALNTALFYALFDYTLNILEGRKWDYLGTTAKWDITRNVNYK